MAQLERVEVTGSNIKRISAESASPVQVITRAEIKQTGANTVRQILDTITATSPELLDNGAGASFAAGATGASMRNLGKGATLVLLNGRRLPNFGLADGGQYTFVNTDAIPADAIERVEVLKDGASSVYGSDAMAGVINLITRKKFDGISATASYQSGVDRNKGKQKTAALVGGFGDREADGFNVLANIEFYQRDGYMLSDILKYYPGWHYQYVNPSLGAASLVSSPGNIMSGTNFATRTAVPSCPSSQRNSVNACTTDLNAINQASDPAKRVNLYASGVMDLSDTMEVFGDVLFSRTRTEYLSVPLGINAPGSPFRWYDGLAKTVRVVNKPLLPVGHPLNSGTSPVGLEYRFMDPGLDWSAPTDASQYRFLAGVRGQLKNGWDWEAAASRVGGQAVKESLAAHSATFISAIQSNEYKIGGTNSKELLDRMFRSAALNGDNYQNIFDAKLTGDLFTLPSGRPLMAAFGGELRQESLKIKSTDEVMRAELIGRGAIWVEGKRSAGAMYAELDGDVFKSFNVNAALRYDKSQGYGGNVSPKLGLRYEVSPAVLLRGTAAGGFRAPNIPEVLGKAGLTGFFNGTFDPKRCQTATEIRNILQTGNASDKQEATAAFNSGCSASVPAMIAANPNVKPERSRSVTFGVVLQPVRNISLAMDYWKIERFDEIAYRSPSYVLQREGQPGYETLISRLPITSQDSAWADRANQLKPGANLSWNAGQLLTLLLQYENFGKTETSGIDVVTRGRIDGGDAGTLILGFDATYQLTLRSWDISANAYRPNTVGLRSVPRVKAVASANWVKGDWNTGLRFNYRSSTDLNFDETDVSSWSPAACAARLRPTEGYYCGVDDDLTVGANIAYTGFKNLRLLANVNNLLNTPAPVDLRGGYGTRARTVKLSGEYKF